MRFLFILIFSVFLSSCAAVDPEKAPLVIEPAHFKNLPGWTQDNHKAALNAFSHSCARILKKKPTQSFGPDGIGGTYGDWQPACQAMPSIAAATPQDARLFFETWFTPWKATMSGRKDKGLFTGYYEASLNGALQRSGPYQYPLLARPDDLVMVDLGEFRDHLRGERIAGRVTNGKLKPYEDRQAIENGSLTEKKAQPLVWVDDPVDSFFLHIQGSGRVKLSNGDFMRVGYAGQNGHPYYAIGRELIHRGHIEKDNVSLQSIRAWLKTHPGEASEVMNTNASYVFFRELKNKGPLGGEGIPLTPRRSLAIDRSRLPYGVPIWVDIEPPVAEENQLRRLMIAQDTGGAIRGAVRGDVFWGHGKRAEYLAGKMKSQGRYWLLLPKNTINTQ